MHQAQKATSLQGLRSTVEFVLMIADKDPSALDKLDTDKIIDHAADAAGIPPDVIKPQDQVDAVRQARAAAAVEQQAAENTQRSADAAKKLSETNTRQPSALSDLAQASSTGGVLPTGVTP
jgi:acetyl/propionyl-CoA carboxylase alpha subunit